MNEREAFYKKGVQDLIVDKNASILICGGGSLDKMIFQELGFSNVTISNLDERLKGNEFSPFKWKYENAESLSFQASSFDYVVIHAAMHHASSPHKVLTEMYRVALKGVLAFESRDSVIMRFLEKFGAVRPYEHKAVYQNACKYGGLNNTEIPNFVYRWTEREIEKTIQSYAPYCKHRIVYRYGCAFPTAPESEKKGQFKLAVLKCMRPFYSVFIKIYPKQQNQFAFFIEKPTMSFPLFPWLLFDSKENRIKFNKEWGDRIYKG